MNNGRRSIGHLRSKFDEIYNTKIVGGGFFEFDEYKRNEKERYWRTLQLLCRGMPMLGREFLKLAADKSLYFANHCSATTAQSRIFGNDTSSRS